MKFISSVDQKIYWHSKKRSVHWVFFLKQKWEFLSNVLRKSNLRLCYLCDYCRLTAENIPFLPIFSENVSLTRFVTNIDQPKTINVLCLPIIDFNFFLTIQNLQKLKSNIYRFFLPFNKNYFTSKYYTVLEILDKSWVRDTSTPWPWLVNSE